MPHSRSGDLSQNFLRNAADLIADTQNKLSGERLVKITSKYAYEWNVEIFHATYPLAPSVANKRTALFDNLRAFSASQQFQIILELCKESELKKNREAIQQLRTKLISEYGHLADAALNSELDMKVVEMTRHFLNPFPKALRSYEEAVTLIKSQSFSRHALDSLRLAFEELLHDLLSNNNALEKQQSHLNAYLSQCGVSEEVKKMIEKMRDQLVPYQNKTVKHRHAVIEQEIEVIFEATFSPMKFLVRFHSSAN